MSLPKHITDVMDPARAQALMVTLGSDQAFVPGDALPPFAHHIYFWEALPPSALGRDKHPKLGGFIPDLGLPRRMWAGGRMEFLAPLKAGKAAMKTSSVTSAIRKDGRSGPLGIVTVDHTIDQGGKTVVKERQDLVYLPDRDPGTPWPDPPQATLTADHSQTVRFDTTLLFRYSALTFNGHRIHYDLDYCQNVEGYSGLVVHGPLLAQMLVLFAQGVLGGPLHRFNFRLTAPLMHFETARLCMAGNDVWVEGPDRRLCLKGTVA